MITDVGADSLVCEGFMFPVANFDRFQQLCLVSHLIDLMLFSNKETWVLVLPHVPLKLLLLRVP